MLTRLLEPQRMLGALAFLAWLVFMLRTGRIAFGGEGFLLPPSRSWMPILSWAWDWTYSVPLVMSSLLMVFWPETFWPTLGHVLLFLFPVAFILVHLVPARLLISRKAFSIMALHERVAEHTGARYADSLESTDRTKWLYPLRAVLKAHDGAWLALTMMPNDSDMTVVHTIVCASPVQTTGGRDLVWGTHQESGHFGRIVSQAVEQDDYLAQRVRLVQARDESLEVYITPTHKTEEEVQELMDFTRRLAGTLDAAGVVQAGH